MFCENSLRLVLNALVLCMKDLLPHSVYTKWNVWRYKKAWTEEMISTSSSDNKNRDKKLWKVVCILSLQIWKTYLELLRISPYSYSVWMWENTGQNNSKYRHFLRSECVLKSVLIYDLFHVWRKLNVKLEGWKYSQDFTLKKVFWLIK